MSTRSWMENRLETTNGTEYVIRTYESGDEEGFVALHNLAWGDGDPVSVEWFNWKYHENPIDIPVPVVVAEADGEIVGIKGSVPYRLQAGQKTVLAFRGDDLVVHPAHRGQGLYPRMAALEREYFLESDAFAGHRPSFRFSYANEKSLSGTQKIGSKVLGARNTYYRVQNPRPYVRDRVTHPTLSRVAGGVVTVGSRAYLDICDRLSKRDDEVEVRRRSGLPVTVLTTVAASAHLEAIHPLCDEAFYEWHFDDPRRGPDETYLAFDDGVVACIVVRTTHDAQTGATVASLLHAVPMGGEGTRRAAWAALLSRIVADHSDVRLVKAWNPTFSPSVLTRQGFFSNQASPLSWVHQPRQWLVARLYTAEDWMVYGRPIQDARDYLWSLRLQP